MSWTTITENVTETIEKKKLKSPKNWHVIMLNDDYTSMECVVEILVSIFGKSDDEAIQIMFHIHNTGSSVVGTYFKSIAEEKQKEAISYARAGGYPLEVEIKEES